MREFIPRSYQAPAIAHILEHPRCAIWGTPGVGKTVIVLSALRMLRMALPPAPVLILATLRVARSTWTTEAARWRHLQDYRVQSLVLPPAKRLEALHAPADAYAINYEQLNWLIDYWGEDWPYQVVVADEATKLKSNRLSYRRGTKADGSPGKIYLAGEGGKRARALGMLAHRKVERFIQLTGTPAPNGLKDLWGQVWYLDAGNRLGRTYSDFSSRWFNKGPDGYELIPKSFADEQIHVAVADICLSIQAKDYFDLRAPIHHYINVQLPEKARQQYKAVAKEFFLQLTDGRKISAANSGAKSMKLLQMANGACYVDPALDVDDPMARKDWALIHDEKLEAAQSLVEELNGEPVILIYEFFSDWQRLEKGFPKARTLKTQKDEDDFKAGRIPVLLMHPQSGGHGIDGFQHACRAMIFFGHSWNLEYYQQAVERIGPTRQVQAGYDRDVHLYFIIAEGTIDELVMEKRASKAQTQALLMDAVRRNAEGLPSAWQDRVSEAEETLGQ